MTHRIVPVLTALLLVGCVSDGSVPETTQSDATESSYFDNSGRDDVLAGGIRMIPIETPRGTFDVWTKRVGNNPTIKVLLLHGGPGVTHEYFEAFDSYFPAAGIEYYYYDQLGSFYSDQPDDCGSVGGGPRFVDEVEQVRMALGLGPDNFYLLGQSWGGILALEYALQHQDKLKGLIISNMMASIPAYNEYARTVLMPEMDPAALAEIQAFEAAEDYANPAYMELLVEHHYVDHVLRMPPGRLAGSGEPGVRPHESRCLRPHAGAERVGRERPAAGMGSYGRSRADRSSDPDDRGASTTPWIPTTWSGWPARSGTAVTCTVPEGSHLSMYDDQAMYFEGLIEFLEDVDAGRFPASIR